MNVELMRRIDFYVGVPLCFASTILWKIVNTLLPRSRRRPRNALFIELSEMGSAVLADPAMRKLKRETGAHLFFAIFSRNRATLDILKTVPKENIFEIRESSFLLLTMDTIRFLRWAREQCIDTVIDLELFSRYSALLAGYSGAPNRVGFYSFACEGLYRGRMMTHNVAYNPHIHIAKGFMALVNSLLREEPEVPYSKTLIADEEIELAKAPISDAQRAGMTQRIRRKYDAFDPAANRLVLINPSAGDLLPQRRWPTEYFEAVAKRLLEDYPDVVVLITGSREERKDADVLRKTISSDRCVNFAGETGLAELPALYSISSLMLTNDSGPAHFAAVTQLSTFVLFGPETPDLYRPLGNSIPIYAGLACSPCVSAANHRNTVCRDNVCMRVIKPETVLEKLREALDDNRA